MEFWRDKKVLITGAWGFIGSHLAAHLIEAGASVCVLNPSDQPAPGSIWQPAKLQQLAEVFVGDITNHGLVDEIFRNHRPEFCFHLAAQPLVDVASKDPVPTFSINIGGTWNILDLARQHGLQGVVIASTSHVYGDNQPPFLEDYFPRPSRPYETSKACADLLAQTYANYYELPVGIARCVNIYGPGDHNTRIVPRSITRILEGQAPELFQEAATRDYLFIDDAVSGYLMLAEQISDLRAKQRNVIYNFGTGQHYSTRHLLTVLLELMNRTDLTPMVIAGTRRQEIEQQYVSIDKAKQSLGWQPKYSLADGLRQTIEWYRRQSPKSIN